MNQPVIFFNSVMSWGGGEKWHLEAARHMRAQGRKVVIFCRPDSELEKRARDCNLPTEAIDVRKFTYLNPIKVSALARQIRAVNPAAIIMNLSSDVKAAGMASKQAGVPRIIYRRGSAIPLKKHVLNRYLFKSVVTEILANSEETKSTINQKAPLMNPEQIKVIYNGLKFEDYRQEASPLYQRKGNEFIFGNAGRLVYQKNQVDLILMASQLEKKGVNFKVLVAGSGHLEKDLKALVHKRKLEHRFEWLGFVKEMDAFYRSIDAFVLTSRWEGFGYVLAEAGYFEKPVLAYRVSSNPELVVHEETGLLSPIHQIDALAENAQKLISNPQLVQELGSKAHQRVLQQFDFYQNMQELEDWLFRQ